MISASKLHARRPSAGQDKQQLQLNWQTNHQLMLKKARTSKQSELFIDLKDQAKVLKFANQKIKVINEYVEIRQNCLLPKFKASS